MRRVVYINNKIGFDVNKIYYANEFLFYGKIHYEIFDIDRYLGIYPTIHFVDLAEWRNKQIDEILV